MTRTDQEPRHLVPAVALATERNTPHRFLAPQIVTEAVLNDRFWDYLAAEIPALMRRAETQLAGKPSATDGLLM